MPSVVRAPELQGECLLVMSNIESLVILLIVKLCDLVYESMSLSKVYSNVLSMPSLSLFTILDVLSLCALP